VDDVVSAKRNGQPGLGAAPQAQNMAMAGGEEGMNVA